MPRELHLVADTNLFFECKSLSQLPWQDLGGDPIIILLTSPLLSEIDKHKKGSGRTRGRALKVFQIVRDMLKTKQTEYVISEENPRVVLRKLMVVEADPAYNGALNYLKVDDQLVGITSTLSKSAKDYDVGIITDDTNVAATADHLGLHIELIDESWRREPQQSDEQVRIQKLEKDRDAYRQQEPIISCNITGLDEGNDKISRTIAEVKSLTSDQIDEALDALREKHPMTTDFSTPPDEIHGAEAIESLQRWTFVAPTCDEIARYQKEAYPAWLEQCRSKLENLHKGYPDGAESIVLNFEFENQGSRPAEDARIEFQCDGDIAIYRLPDEEDGLDDDEVADNASEVANPAPWERPSFSVPPSSPKADRIIHRAPLIKTPRRRVGTDLAALSARHLTNPSIGAAIQARERWMASGRDIELYTTRFHGLDIAKMNAAVNPLDSIGSAMRGIPGLAYEKAMKRAMGLDRPNVDHSFARPVFEPISTAHLSRLKLPDPHDAEAFYFRKWGHSTPTKNGAITCDLWRHQKKPVEFELRVIFAGKGSRNGRIVCKVHAGNLTHPVSKFVVVTRKVESRSFELDANQMIEDV